MNKRYPSLLAYLMLCIFTFQSCQNKDRKTSDLDIDDTEATASDTLDMESDNDDDDDGFYDEEELVFPKTGTKIVDFLPQNTNYEVHYMAEGDLNNDGLTDLAVILQHKAYKYAERPTLILLQTKDKSYQLDKVSNLVMPPEYTDSDFKLYDTEDISINDGLLKIQLFGIGPSGNLFSDFKYFGNELLLTSIETYNMGAGSHQSPKKALQIRQNSQI